MRTVFRIVGRDTVQGTIAGDYLAERWGDQDIAIVHDGQAYGAGLAEAVEEAAEQRGVSPRSMFETIEPGKADYGDLIDRLQASGIDVLFFGGYAAESALIIRQARSAVITICSWSGRTTSTAITSGGSRGRRARVCVSRPFPTCGPSPKRRRWWRTFRAQGYEPEGITLQNYVAVRVWAQAVEVAGTLELDAVIETLRTHKFDTVYGTIGFDDKGDVYRLRALRVVRLAGGQLRAGRPGRADRVKHLGST